MRIDTFQVDAFTDRPFSGNPAAVCLLDEWIEDSRLQAIAAENNLSETAFAVAAADGWELRWFTPTIEVDLCGHATLATAHVLFEHRGVSARRISFRTKSGVLGVERGDARTLVMDFPSRPAAPAERPVRIADALGRDPAEVLAARDLLAVFENEEEILAITPDFELLSAIPTLGVIVTAPGRSSDFVSRFFAPRAGIPEDPVTGSAHCTLVPYWASRLGKHKLHAFQRSARGGELFLTDRGERVAIGGRAVTVLSGTFLL